MNHQQGIKEVIDELFEDAKTNPILASYIKEARLDATRQYVAEQMNLSYEDVSLVIEQDFMEKYL